MSLGQCRFHKTCPPGGSARSGSQDAPGPHSPRNPAPSVGNAREIWSQRMRGGRGVRDLHLGLPPVQETISNVRHHSLYLRNITIYITTV